MITKWAKLCTEKFLILGGQSAKYFEGRLVAVNGKTSPSSATIKRWVKEFQCGKERLEDLVMKNRRIVLHQ